MGRGQSKIGGGSGGGAAIMQSPISTLQQTVAGARSGDLMGVYDTLGNRPLAGLSNEEKMVRAVVIDELAERGNLIYDPKSGAYSKYSRPQEIVYDNGKSYRIKSVDQRSVFAGNNQYTTADFADAELYYNGKWAQVKNPTIQRDLAVKYKAKKNT
jgi:hypothetical protein